MQFVEGSNADDRLYYFSCRQTSRQLKILTAPNSRHCLLLHLPEAFETPTKRGFVLFEKAGPRLPKENDLAMKEAKCFQPLPEMKKALGL